MDGKIWPAGERGTLKEMKSDSSTYKSYSEKYINRDIGFNVKTSIYLTFTTHNRHAVSKA